MTNLFARASLALCLFILPAKIQCQQYFQNYYTRPGYAFTINVIAQLPGGQITIGGQQTTETTGQKTALALLISESGTLLWAQQYGDPASQPTILDLAPTPDGKLLAVISAPVGNGSLGLAKIDLNGNLEWSRFFSAGSNVEILRVHPAGTGYILTGIASGASALVIKTDLTGAETWSVAITAAGGTMSLQQAWSDPSGNVYVAGSLLQNGYTDGILLKLSSAGNLDWSRRFGSSENDALTELAPTADGQLLAGGHTYGVDNFNKGWLLKVGLDGAVKWSRTYGLPGMDLRIRSLRDYPGGAVFSISADGTVPSLGAGIARVNTSGDLSWIKNYNQSGSFGLNPQIDVTLNDQLLLCAALQTGSGRGCLLIRANSEGDAPPCCLPSANLTVLDFQPQSAVFVPTVSTAPGLLPKQWSNTPFNAETTNLCLPANLDFTLSDSILCPGACIDLEILDPTPGSAYTWSYPGGVPDPNVPNRVCFPTLENEVTITLTANSCKHQQRKATIKPKAGDDQFPNAFTPNGDAVNDVFRPLLNCETTAYRFFIYNRWGDLVFESTDPNLGWDGRVNGSPAPSDVYLWVLETGHATEMRLEKGDVTLLR